MHLVAVVSVGTAATVAACGGGGGGGNQFALDGSAGGDTGTLGDSGVLLGDGGGDSSLIGTKGSVTAIALSPATASLSVNGGKTASATFTVQATYSDGSTGALTSGLTWSVDSPLVGSVSAAGVFTATGSLGGVVNVTASYMGLTAKAVITVKLVISQNTGGAPPSVIGSLKGATKPDPSVVWAYPYDGTVWPRGILPPILQWNGGGATDIYYVHIVSSTFELQQFTTATKAPASQLPVDPTIWQQFTDSSSGAAQVTVARWDGTTATQIASHTWTIAPASMRGTIYYWSNDLGRVLRIQPGSPTTDDFANKAPLNDPAQYTQSSCLMTCHTVSADGSTLISGGGVFGGSYDLLTGQPTYSLGGTWGPVGGGPSSSTVVKWMSPAVSPTGKYILTNAQAEDLAYQNNNPALTGFLGLYTTADGMPVPASGMMNVPVTQPAWSPEGSRVVFVDSGDPVSTTSPWATWINPPPGDLKVYSFDEKKNPMFFGLTTLVSTGADPNKRIMWPTVTPDGKGVIYGRGVSSDSRACVASNPCTAGDTANANLYFASTTKANTEVSLDKLNGVGYPFAAGSRDLSWDFEPSFAPVAAGGYFWVVFTSRRTYGNILTGPAEGTGAVKQLWVAAIDLNPKPGADPSHAAFHLEGQNEANLAMRGFWSLPPCSKDGMSCATGTDCCGGFCANGADGGAPVCQSQQSGCSQNGNKCNVTSDCCGAASGVTCINKVCSEPPPQ